MRAVNNVLRGVQRLLAEGGIAAPSRDGFGPMARLACTWS
jgi:hypothetical protein